MRVKKTNRYFCDFCRKQGGHAGHMRKHEMSCTGNRNRTCKLCRLAMLEQKSMTELHEALKKDILAAVDFQSELLFVRAASGGCPACILAAIRTFDWSEMPEGLMYHPEFCWQYENKKFFESGKIRPRDEQC